jgi:hypothetical protein
MIKTKKQKHATTKTTNRSFAEVIGADTYAVWVCMLQELVPHGRTHRLSVLLASMLQYAASVAVAERKEERDDTSLVTSLIQASEVGDPSEVEELLHDAVVHLFKDAKVPFERTSTRGTKYSIAEEAYAEFIHWYDMPWE